MPCTELATAHTMAFLARHLPAAPARILEVGCGRGEVAAALGALGYQVDAIDIDADAVAAARALGVPARQADFFAASTMTYDVVLFTRSLHHLAPLARAIDHAYEILAPGGSIVVEDFAVEAMDAATATWFYDLCALLGVTGALSPAQDTAPDPLATWVAEHQQHHGEEPLHTGASMRSALAARLAMVATERVPYLYRTIVRRSDDRALAAAFLATEEQRIASGHLQPIGLRMVARSQSGPSIADAAPIIRLAHAGDVPAILAIYAPLVRDTTISFEYEPPTTAEMEQRLQTIQRDHPWLVCERDGQVAGYAYASAFRSRAAYRWTAEVTVYIHADHGRRGLAQTLYRALFERLRAQGYRTAVAVITLPNPGSVALHERLGFQPVGIFQNAGFKHGQWLDTGWWQLDLGGDAAPSLPHPPDHTP